VEACAFDFYLTQIAQLTRAQCTRVLARIMPAVDQGRIAAVIEAAAAPGLCCPCCQGKQLYRHGAKSGLQRFRCRACGRTFNSLTGTPLARLRHKEKWLDFGECMLDSGSVREAAARLGVDKNTSLRWRHRFLKLTKTDRPACLNGIAEADETFLLELQKGARNLQRTARKRGGRASKRGISKEQVCILVARDRSGNTVDFVTGRGPVTVAQLKEHLRPVLAPDALLVTDAATRPIGRLPDSMASRINMSISAPASACAAPCTCKT
jgi:transposase-like protein